MDNRKRALSEVVALEAWHQRFSVKRRAAKLFVDVVFTDGRIGGKADPVRFRLSIKKAEVVVVIPPTELARIDKASVSREAPLSDIVTVEQDKSVKKAKAKGGVGLEFDGVPKPKLGVSGAIGFDGARTTEKSRKSHVPAVTAMQTKTADGQYAWRLAPGWGETLLGRPWDARKEHRLKVVDQRVDPSRGLEPSVRVEVRCRREDLEISDIQLTGNQPFTAKLPLGRNKEVAAEALIRSRLFEAGLFSSTDLSDPFAEMVLCATTAESVSDE